MNDNPWTQVAIKETLACLSGPPNNFDPQETSVRVIWEWAELPESKLIVLVAYDRRSHRTVESAMDAPQGRIFTAAIVTKGSNTSDWKPSQLRFVPGKESKLREAEAVFFDTPLTRFVAGIARNTTAVTAKINIRGHVISQRIIEGAFFARIDQLLPPLTIELLNSDQEILDSVNIP